MNYLANINWYQLPTLEQHNSSRY